MHCCPSAVSDEGPLHPDAVDGRDTGTVGLLPVPPQRMLLLREDKSFTQIWRCCEEALSSHSCSLDAASESFRTDAWTVYCCMDRLLYLSS